MSRLVFAAAVLPALLLFACRTTGGEEATPVETGTTMAEPTATPVPAADSVGGTLAFFREGGLWRANIDGTDETRFADAPCPISPKGAIVDWSADGESLALECATGFPDTRRSVIVVDSAGRSTPVLQDARDAIVFKLSPDGRQLAYGTHWLSSPGEVKELRVFDLATGQHRLLMTGAHLLSWPLPDRMLVGLNPSSAGLRIFWDSHWLNPTTGELDAVPRLDDAAQFWLTPSADKAVVMQTAPDLWDEAKGGFPLAVYDFASGEEVPIRDSGIAFPSEGIPWSHVAVSRDATQVYWATVAGSSGAATAAYRAELDGTGHTKLEDLPPEATFYEMSPDGVLAYELNGEIVVRDLESGTQASVPDAVLIGWRPTP